MVETDTAPDATVAAPRTQRSVLVRRGPLIRAMLSVLADVSAPVPAGQVVAQVAERVDLTADERSHNASGYARFDTFVRFASGWAKNAGWLVKAGGTWSITDQGREALRDIPEDEISRVVLVGARTRVDLVGFSGQTVGSFLRKVPVPTAHRILSGSGAISAEFTWPDPSRSESPRALLEAEGLTCNANGQADPARRITAEDWRLFIEPVAPGTRAWLVKGSAVSGVNVVPQWRAKGFVSLAAAHLRPVEPGVAFEDLRAAVDADYGHLSTASERRSSGSSTPSSIGSHRTTWSPPRRRARSTSSG